MTVETMAGTAAYLREHAYDTGAVKVRVATPGGATERGLIALEENGLARRLPAAVDAVGGGNALMDSGSPSRARTWRTTCRRSRTSTWC